MSPPTLSYAAELLTEQPSPALESPPTRPPWWRSGPLLMAVAGVLAVIVAASGMAATGALTTDLDGQSMRADRAADNTRTLAGQVQAACNARAVAPTPVGVTPCVTAGKLAGDPLADPVDARALFDQVRRLIEVRPPGPARLDPAQVTASAARSPVLSGVDAGALERTSRAAVAAEQGAASDDEAVTARSIRYGRDGAGVCRVTITYADGHTAAGRADDASCGPAPAGPPPPPPTSRPAPSSTPTAPTTTSPEPSSTPDETPTTSTNDAPQTTSGGLLPPVLEPTG